MIDIMIIEPETRFILRVFTNAFGNEDVAMLCFKDRRTNAISYKVLEHLPNGSPEERNPTMEERLYIEMIAIGCGFTDMTRLNITQAELNKVFAEIERVFAKR